MSGLLIRQITGFAGSEMSHTCDSVMQAAMAMSLSGQDWSDRDIRSAESLGRGVGVTSKYDSNLILDGSFVGNESMATAPWPTLRCMCPIG